MTEKKDSEECEDGLCNEGRNKKKEKLMVLIDAVCFVWRTILHASVKNVTVEEDNLYRNDGVWRDFKSK